MSGENFDPLTTPSATTLRCSSGASVATCAAAETETSPRSTARSDLGNAHDEHGFERHHAVPSGFANVPARIASIASSAR